MRATLGEFEHLILLATMRLNNEAYGAAIADHLERQTGREISQAATYIALKRLTEKGMLASASGPNGPTERGGRPRRYFSVTEEGLRQLKSSGAAILGMWAGMEDLLREHS